MVEGPDGDTGWSPVFAVVADGTRRVLQVSDWTGGEGTKPATGSYIGTTGLVANIADAVDIRGTTGTSAPATQIQFSVDGATLWHDTFVSGDLFIRYSVDGGSTWGTGYRFIGQNGTNAPTVQMQYSPDNATWHAFTAGDIYIRFSVDGGSTWSAGYPFTSSGVNTDVEFDDADLSAGVLTVTGLRTIVSVIDNSGAVIIPDSITYGAENTSVDLESFGTISGTWKVLFAQGKDGTNGEDGLDGISFVWKGAYSDATTYAANEVVSYSGSTYISLQGSNLNKVPGVDTDYWSLMAQKGTDGTNGADAPQDNWRTVTASSYTATPASTSTLTMSDTSAVNVGDAIKYTDGRGTYFAVITAVTANTSITIAGAAFDTGSNLTALYVGNNKVIQLDFCISGLYADGTGDLLAADMNTYFKWQGRKAYLVAFSAVHKTADTTTNPKINVKVNGSAVSTNDSNNGVQLSTAGTWVDNSAVAISTSNYDINRGEAVEINCTAAGGTADAANLTVSCVFVQE
jgi:hypothetical protein